MSGKHCLASWNGAHGAFIVTTLKWSVSLINTKLIASLLSIIFEFIDFSEHGRNHTQTRIVKYVGI